MEELRVNIATKLETDARRLLYLRMMLAIKKRLQLEKAMEQLVHDERYLGADDGI